MCGRLTKGGSDLSVFIHALSRAGTHIWLLQRAASRPLAADSRDNWATVALLMEVAKLNRLEPRRPSSLTPRRFATALQKRLHRPYAKFFTRRGELKALKLSEPSLRSARQTDDSSLILRLHCFDQLLNLLATTAWHD